MSANGLRLDAPRAVRTTSVIEVVATRGRGDQDDPVREVTQYWSSDGQLLAEKDSIEKLQDHVKADWIAGYVACLQDNKGVDWTSVPVRARDVAEAAFEKRVAV